MTEILLQERPCLELLSVSSNFDALLFVQDEFLESGLELLVPVKKS